MILAVCPNPAIDTLIYLKDLKKGEVNRIQKEAPFPGGKGVHVGLGVKELGYDVVVLGIWGGLTGQWIKDELKEKGIECIGPNVNEWTRICQTIKSESAFDETEILGVGPKINTKIFNLFLDAFQKFLPDATIVSMSGSWPPGAPDDAYAQMVRLAKEKSISTIIDCTGIQFENAKKENPTACHLNYSEAKSITKKVKIDDQLIALKKNFEIPLITKGAEGLYISKENDTIWSKVEIKEVISAVGSGDAVTSGLVVGIANDYNLLEIAKLAVACGAANCIRPELGLFHKEDVNKLEKQVIIR